MKRVLLWCALIFVAGVPGARAKAQDQAQRAVFSGVVVNPSGAAVPGAEVRVHSGAGADTVVHSGSTGAVSTGVKSGAVQVDVTAPGFKQLHWEARAVAVEPVRLVMSAGVGSYPVHVATPQEVPLELVSSSAQLVQLPPSAPRLQRSPVGEVGSQANWEYGLQASGGVGLEDRSNFSFLNAGVHAGRVLTPNFGSGVLQANFEYGVEVIPFWQSYTPKFQKLNCPTGATVASQCKGPTTSGGTYRGVSIVPIQLRVNFTHGARVMPWIQGAGGVLYTSRKYPGIGNLNVGDPTMTGPAADTSVWNFTPQGGVGMHYFVKPLRSLDFSANAVHISSSSLGDKNPGVNTSVQFAVGYSWWR